MLYVEGELCETVILELFSQSESPELILQPSQRQLSAITNLPSNKLLDSFRGQMKHFMINNRWVPKELSDLLIRSLRELFPSWKGPKKIPYIFAHLLTHWKAVIRAISKRIQSLIALASIPGNKCPSCGFSTTGGLFSYPIHYKHYHHEIYTNTRTTNKEIILLWTKHWH